MEPTSNPDRQPPAETCIEPTSGSGVFLAARDTSRWFTPRHILAMIQPEENAGIILANPPFSAAVGCF